MLTASELQHQFCFQPDHDYLNTKLGQSMKLLLIPLHAQGQHLWALFQVFIAQTKSWEAPTLPWKPTSACMTQPWWRMASNTGTAHPSDASEARLWVKDTRQPPPGASGHAALSEGFRQQQKNSITSVSVWNSVGCASSLIWGKAKAIKAQEVWSR